MPFLILQRLKPGLFSGSFDARLNAVLFCGGTGSVVMVQHYFGDPKERKRWTKEIVCADQRRSQSEEKRQGLQQSQKRERLP